MSKIKRPPVPPYSAHDRRDAVQILRTAKDILLTEESPFPVLEAARRVKVRTDTRAWELVTQARAVSGCQRDAQQLQGARELIERGWSPPELSSFQLTRVPRCRHKVPGGRCGRPLSHTRGCAPDPPVTDLVRSLGTDHVLLGGPPTETSMIMAWEEGHTGGSLRVRRDDHDRGLWIDTPPRTSKPILLGWTEIRRLALEFNLELADHGNTSSKKTRV